MKDENFKEELEELVRLFEKLKNKANRDKYAFDDNYIANIEMFIKSYNLNKDNMSDEIMDQMGKMAEPLRQMIRQMISELKRELDEDEMLHPEENDEEQKMFADKKIEVGPSIEEIDRLLKIPGLPIAEINKLLDERKRISLDNKDK